MKQDDWLWKGVKSRRKAIKYVCLSQSFQGNNAEGYALMLLMPVAQFWLHCYQSWRVMSVAMETDYFTL